MFLNLNIQLVKALKSFYFEDKHFKTISHKHTHFRNAKLVASSSLLDNHRKYTLFIYYKIYSKYW